jgi:hypothetical protein
VRQLWNGKVNKHPAALVRCANAQDVVHTAVPASGLARKAFTLPSIHASPRGSTAGLPEAMAEIRVWFEAGTAGERQDRGAGVAYPALSAAAGGRANLPVSGLGGEHGSDR